MQHIDQSDPIFAIATCTHRSALHLHRLSGYGIFEKLSPYIRTKSHNTPIQPHYFPYIKHVCVYDENHSIIDDVVLIMHKSPKSFTGEDLIEITCHGNPLISKKLQTFFRFLDFRDAREGEFTSRAFFNGKLDLTQAEAIRELINAETYAAVQLSQGQLSGGLSKEIYTLREKFLEVLSYFEAHIDFSTDEVGNYEPNLSIPKIQSIIDRLNVLKNSYTDGLKLKEGIKIVLCGRPNAGKSTLYNKLLKSDRAIVTHIPGTTRDILRDHLVLENRDFILIDTAGLRQTKNLVETFGIERTFHALQHADIICVLIDSSKQLSKKFLDSLDKIKEQTQNQRKLIFAISKSDLSSQEKLKAIESKLKKHFQIDDIVFVSQEDISELQNTFIKIYDTLMVSLNFDTSLSPILISTRAHDKVVQALSLLKDVVILLNNIDLPEKIASLLYCALRSLEEILGEVDMNDVYQKIFSTFCIGK